MSRFRGCVFAIPVVLLIIWTAALTGCKSGSAVTTTNYPVPASITITPAPYLSLEVGTNQAFTATVQSAAKISITEPVFYQSSNTAVVTVAANGTACAGSWDSLSNPQVCTPGPIGVAQITATSLGVSSPATTVYVHQHIDRVVISAIPPVPPTPCLSVGQTVNYQATAYSRGTNITPTVGVFNWQAVTQGVASLSTTPTVLQLGQVQVTAEVPGVTPIFATIGNTTSVPVTFTTCAVQSILLDVTNSTSSFKSIIPTVIDTLGNTITGVPLTWSSSEPASVAAGSGNTSATTGGGAGTVIASCTPPTCNIGFLPSLPIYPESAVLVVPSAETIPPNSTVFATSTACGTTDNCLTAIYSVTTPANTVSPPTLLPSTPNSLVFNRQGTQAYIGTDSGLFGSKGLQILDASSSAVSEFPSTPGKVLAVAPDGSKVIVSDTQDVPNQVFVFDTGFNTPAAFNISGATAADFSPDSLKAYILAGSTLYVYSKLDALQTIPLSAPANDVSFFAEGAFAYLAGGNAAGVLVRRTCDNGTADAVSTPGAPAFIKALPDASGMLALDPPTVDIIHATTTPAGCTPSVSDTVTSFDFGLGNFVATQLILSQDGTAAYVVMPGRSSISIFSVASETFSSIALTGNPVPLQASLSPDGTELFVGAGDGTLHILEPAVSGDIHQVSFPLGLCQNSAGQPFGITCNPDLVAVKP